MAKALQRLNLCGFEAYCVGGCVRDYMMGVQPHDFDITTSALPDEVAKCFDDCRVIETGIKHGTVTVVLENEMLEITTFRTDGNYSDGRHPDSVSFTPSLTQDLARRDFTINAMAYNCQTGLVDPFGGGDHIISRTICCVGQAQRRFSEDALRILRALRFSSVLCFEIESQTRDAIFQKADTLKKISSERIYAEFLKLLCGDNVQKILLDFREIFAVFIPQLEKCFDFDQKSKYHQYDVYTHIVKTVAKCPKDPIIRLAAFLHDIAKPDCFTIDENGCGHAFNHQKKSAEMAKEILRSLHCDNKTICDVVKLIEHHDDKMLSEKLWVKELISSTSFEFARKLMKLKRADILTHAKPYTSTNKICDIEKIIDDLERENACLFLKDLKISGNDLLKIGICDGKAIGQTLKYLLDLVIKEEITNSYHDLMSQAEIYKNKL